MKRSEVWDNIIEAFQDKYSFLGEQFAEEFMLTCASWNIQEHSLPDYRIRRHLLLFWIPGWIKSSLLMKAYNVLGDDMCMHMTDVSTAALRGTVESGKFMTPFTLKRPFAVCTEFGQLSSSSDTEIIQKLLNVLEEGVVNVSLGKISWLTAGQRFEIEQKLPITFIDDNTFTYKTNWILMAGTYNKKYLVDNALESRFVVMTPKKVLDSSLAKYINRADPFHLDLDTVNTFRTELLSTDKTDVTVDLPDEVYDMHPELTMRDTSYLNSYILCKEWWGQDVSKEDIINRAQQYLDSRMSLWSTSQEKLFSCIEQTAKTMGEIMSETGLKKDEIVKTLKAVGARATIDKEGKKRWII
jgi:hypothetical protein